MFSKSIFVSGAIALATTHSTGALASRFEVDFDAAKIAGSSCRLGENAFLERAGNNAINLEIGMFRASVGTFDGDAGTARATCAVVLPGRLPRGFTVRAVRSEGTYDVLKSASADARLAVTVAGGGIRTEAEELVFPKSRSAFAEGAAFSLTNVAQGEGALCNPSRGEDVTLSVIYAASVVKGSLHSYANIELSPGRRIRVSFEIRACRG